MKIAFITNLPSHYLLGLFEMMDDNYDLDLYFFSAGNEKWIDPQNDLLIGDFNIYFLKSKKIFPHININIPLIRSLINGRYDIYLHYILGPMELLSTYIISRLLKKKFILYTDLWFKPDSLFHNLSFPIIRLIYKNSDAIIAKGTHVVDFLLKVGVNKDKIFNSYYVVDNTVFNKIPKHTDLDFIKETYNLDGKFVVLYVGRLSEEKGLTYLLEAVKEISEKHKVELLLIGAGEEKKKLLKYCADNDLKNVHFIGHIPNIRLYIYYNLADVFVLPSISTKMLREVWGLVINEAMNQGCPVIATDIVGAAIGGLVDKNSNGIVIHEKSTRELVNAITDLIEDPLKREKLSKNAKEKISSWDYNLSFRGFRNAIDSVVKKK